MFPDVMVDIETGGLSPDHSPILQIAAVRFNVDTQQVDTESMFNRSLLMPANRWWEEGTRDWWYRYKADLLQNIMMRAEDPQVVMESLKDWVGTAPEVPHRFWSKPTHFDFVFISSYFKQFGLHNPFHYRWAVDVNSFIRGLKRSGELEIPPVEFQGDAHNAIFDVLHQIQTVFEALKCVQPSAPSF